MQARMAKLAVVSVVAIGLAVGSLGTASAATVRNFAPLEKGGKVERTRIIEFSVVTDGHPRAGYMVGRFFVGFLSE